MIPFEQWGLVASVYLGINALIGLVSVWMMHANEQEGSISPIREEGVTFAYLFAFMTLFALPMIVSSILYPDEE